jgi:hypothetical protein
MEARPRAFAARCTDPHVLVLFGFTSHQSAAVCAATRQA